MQVDRLGVSEAAFLAAAPESEEGVAVRTVAVTVLAGFWGLAVLGRGVREGIPSPDDAYGLGGLFAFATGVLALVLVGRVMLRSSRARAVGAVVLAACIVAIAGFGGGAGDAARLADCKRGFAAGLSSKQSHLPAGVATATAARFCRELAARDLLDSDGDAVQAAVRNEPQIMYPLCDHAVRREFAFATGAVRTLAVGTDITAFGRSYCDRAVETGVMQLGRSPSPLEVDQLYEAHPKLARQACFLIYMSDVAANPVHGVPVAHVKKVTRAYCADMVAKDLMDWAGVGHTPAQQRQAAALCQRFIADLTHGHESCSV